MNKIIIFGFPHCGTTILRCIISHIEEVLDIIDEQPEINLINLNELDLKYKKYVVCKWPYVINKEDINTKYKNYEKIFIIRNPIFVFSSLNKRFSHELKEGHTLKDYSNAADHFDYYKKNINNYKKLHLIRYEDMFVDNFKNLKDVLSKIGLKYTDIIFDNSKFINHAQLCKNINIPKSKPPNIFHGHYRTYQINQKFANFNDLSNIELSEEQIEFIKNDLYIKTIYPEILEQIYNLKF